MDAVQGTANIRDEGRRSSRHCSRCRPTLLRLTRRHGFCSRISRVGRSDFEPGPRMECPSRRYKGVNVTFVIITSTWQGFGEEIYIGYCRAREVRRNSRYGDLRRAGSLPGFQSGAGRRSD